MRGFPGRANLAVALCALVHAAAFAFFGPALGQSFPLDDAYTHQVYAEGIRYGEGLAYLPGVPAAGSTSPLWALLLAPSQLAPLALHVALTQLLGVIGWVALAVATRALARRFHSDAGIPAAFAIVLDPALAAAALSGMEVILAALLVVLALIALADDRRHLAGLLLGLGVVARPELGLVWLVVNGAAFARERRLSAWLLLPALGFGLAWGAWNHHAAGTLLPTTFFAKHGPQSILDRWRDLPRAALQSMGAWPMTAALPLAGFAVRTLRASLVGRCVIGLLVAWPFALAWAHDLRETWRLYWWRYALPLHPLVLVAVVVGAHRLRRARVALGGLAALLLLGLVQVGPHVAGSARNVAELNVAAARWLDAHAAPDAWIASNDAGAVRRLTGRPVVDLLGLNDATVLVDRAAVLRRRRPSYYVVFPSWFPNLVVSPRFEVVQRFHTDDLQICADCEQSELVVLRPR